MFLRFFLLSFLQSTMALLTSLGRLANRVFGRRMPERRAPENFGEEMDSRGREWGGFAIITKEEAEKATRDFFNAKIDAENAELTARRAVEPAIDTDNWEMVDRDGRTENLGIKEANEFAAFLDNQFDEPSFVF